MAKNKRQTQNNLLIHSRAKVELLGRYLVRYLGVIANTYVKKINIMDLFSSEGIYQNGGEGSPLVILRKVKDLQAQLKPHNRTRVSVLFNDYDPAKIDKLREHLHATDLDIIKNTDIQYRTRNYEEIVRLLPQYISQKKDEKFFIFIDPYSYREIHLGDIKGLLEYGNSEVLLFQPTQFMYRFGSNATPKALSEFMAEVTSHHSQSYETVWQFVEEMKTGFKRHLGHGYYVDTFTIQRDKSTVFSLIFFTRHIRGFEKMLEVKWEMDMEKGRGWKYERSSDMFEQCIQSVSDWKLVLKNF